ncbi:pentatricopeptide repeat-containing protein At2g21090-like [Phoenix dactylifera]|uniref:Pentatricopeptide repeat-containing protein At2g21090-like n=1 Tax=Phoenix dactylifera TaxID=42345 RepID=A0A8B9AM30_PHODC|nr:pentatricopeptide repeat-containing protein At2g21090-like [Phoenix dactylifera]
MCLNTTTSAAAAAAATTVARFLSLIERCIAAKDLRLGRHLHSHLLKTALNHHTVLANRLVHLYSLSGSLPSAVSAFTDLPFKNHHSYNTLLAALCRSGHLPAARQLFDQMSHRDLVSHNTMISTLTHHGHHREAMNLFTRMRKDHSFDKFTVVGVATACANLGALNSLRQLHGAAIGAGLDFNVIMSNVMIDAYGKCGDAEVSRELFDRMETRDVISWTSLVAAYASARRLEEAWLAFDRMPERNAVSWTALVSGYEQNGEGEAALELFRRMIEEGVGPTPFTLVSVLSACAGLGLIARGKQVHGFMVRKCIGLDSFNIFTSNALIDMYAKCGDMASAANVFDAMPERDVVSWNSMVTGFARNGHGKRSLAVFEQMMKAGVTPNHTTFLGVLSACSHAGLVSEGRRFLDSMERKYGLKPRPEHYAAFVDALGRNCQLEEAMELNKDLHSKHELSSVGTWGALLGACRVHGNLELAERASEYLFELEPENGARYLMLSNIYAAAGQWDDVRQVRLLMKGKGFRKDPGFSWIDLRSGKHMFVADDKSHIRTGEIYELLATLVDQMKETRCHLNYEQSLFGHEEGDCLLQCV